MTRPTGQRPGRMPLSVKHLVERTGLLVLGIVVAIGCGSASDERDRKDLLDEPPVPPNLGELDERVVERIEAASLDVRDDPEDARGWTTLGMILQTEHLRQLALVCYEQALARDPDQARCWYWMALIHAREGDAGAAIEAAGRSIELEPDYAPTHYQLGTFQLELGELDLAQRAFERAAELDPAYPGGWVGLARVHLQRDENQAALEVLERVRASHPDDTAVRRLLVTAYRQAGRESEIDAVDAIQEEGQGWNDPWQAELAAVREPTEMRKIELMLLEGRAVEVVELLEAKRATDPDARDFLRQLAEGYYLSGRPEEARATYRELLESEPKNIRARVALARILVQEEQYPGAIARLDEVIAIQPTFATAHEMKGWILYVTGRFEEALSPLKRALELDQRNPKARIWIGFSLLGLSRWEEGLAEFDSILEEHPENGDAHLGRGKALMKLRRFDEAEAALTRAAELGTEQPGVLEVVKRSLEKARERAHRRQAGDSR